MESRKHRIIILCGTCILIVLAVIDLLAGDADADRIVITRLRLPRIMTAAIAGGALALSGTQMQSILRNPLADPHIMGISAGAALGAAIATMIGTTGIPIMLSAFAGATITAAIILAASAKLRRASTLLILGVMTGFIVNAIISIIQFSSDAESLKHFYSWSAGSFSLSKWSDISIMAAAAIVGSIPAFHNSRGFDIILFGDEFAEMTGTDTRKIRISGLLSCSLMTGAVTAFCGPLGFVGIVAPHITRAIFKTSAHRTILPGALLTGSMIGIVSDLLSTLSPFPVPVSSTMALIGIPIIIYILIKGGNAIQ